MILPRVAIIGRTNVGKSTLFNRLSDTVKTIAYDKKGVTRDPVKTTVTWQARSFELIDTGGVDYQNAAGRNDILSTHVRGHALRCLENAELVLFMCDGGVGLTEEDTAIGRLVRKTGKKTIVLVNKEDSTSAHDNYAQFWRLGFADFLTLSALHGTGIGDLLEKIIAFLPVCGGIEKKELNASNTIQVTLLGKPNVGKSSLLNALTHQERAIVSPMPGTTRDIVREKIQFYKENIILADTPGIRRKKTVNESLEKMMVKSSFHALDAAGVALLLVDSAAGDVSDQEIKLAFYAFKTLGKALIILYNKHDLSTPTTHKDLARVCELYDYFLKKVLSLSISCCTGYNLGKIMPLVYDTAQRARTQFSSEELTLLFKKALIKSPLFKMGHQLHLYRAEHIKTEPITIALTVNNPVYCDESSLNFFENVMRAEYNLKSIPLSFVLKRK